MKRFLKALPILAAVILFASCKSDDNGGNIAPPRDYAVQYATEKIAIEEYLKTNYIKSVNADMDVVFDSIVPGDGKISIWDQTEYPLQNKVVTKDNIEYKVYYLKLREGSGSAPTRADQILPAYRGILTDKAATVFDYQPYPTSYWVLSGLIQGFQEIIPLFKSGNLVPDTDPSNPAVYTDFGAGVMFVPSALAYYNGTGSSSVIPPYSTLIFSFKLYDVKFVDTDGDGIETRFERDLTNPWSDPADLDTDGDGIPDYLDADDDGDGFLTKDEIGYTTGQPVIDYNAIQDCAGTTTGLKKHLDPACH